MLTSILEIMSLYWYIVQVCSCIELKHCVHYYYVLYLLCIHACDMLVIHVTCQMFITYEYFIIFSVSVSCMCLCHVHRVNDDIVAFFSLSSSRQTAQWVILQPIKIYSKAFGYQPIKTIRLVYDYDHIVVIITTLSAESIYSTAVNYLKFVYGLSLGLVNF